MSTRVLIVDDDSNLLSGMRRRLRREYSLVTAQGGTQALKIISESETFAVVVSDMRMPEMDGVEFLRLVQTASPDSVRMMLTGNSDQKTAVDAVNAGRIFRFLNKPCPTERLTEAIDAGIEQYRVVTAERKLLSETVAGSAKVLTEMLSLVCPTAFSRCSRLRDLVVQLATELNVHDVWECEVAAMLSQVGCVTIPEAILERQSRGEAMTNDDRQRFRLHPQTGRQLISMIPRLEGVAEIIGYQGKRYDGSGLPVDGVRGQDLPLGARIFAVADDFDTLSVNGHQQMAALEMLKKRQELYDPQILDALENIVSRTTSKVVYCGSLEDLQDGAVITEDVTSRTGLLLIGAGQQVTPSLRMKLTNFDASVGVHLPVATELIVACEAESGGL